MTSSFTILSNSALTLGCMEIGHFHGMCMTGWVLSHSLMVYSPGNWSMPLDLFGNSKMRSSIDLIGVVFLEVPWMTLTAQFILMTSNLSHNGSPRMSGQGVSATYQWEII